MPQITKQQVHDRRQALDAMAQVAGFANDRAEFNRMAREMADHRRALVADCEATSGHVFPRHDIECLFCGAPKDLAQRVLQRNLTRTA